MDDVATTSDALARGRNAYARRAWQDAHRLLALSDDAAALGAHDLELLATAAYMLGLVDDFLGALERAHDAHLAAGEPLRASRCAFTLGVNLFLLGEPGRAGAWLGRSHRLVEAEGGDCAERGYLLMPVAMQNEAAGNYADAVAAAADAAEIGRRFGDRDLFSLALQSQGRILIKQGRLDEGLALLDEAMLAASGDELSPVVTGIVYCGVIDGCEEAYELRRAREWTDALSRWCEEQPQMVAFGGRCLVHRAGIMRLEGAWRDALEEARRGRQRAERAANPGAAGEALYQQGQILRLQGDLPAAEAAYREANRYGREPEPGLSLLRLAQGDGATASSVIHRALAEAAAPLDRARILPALVEISLAVGDRERARAAAEELATVSESFGSAMLRAIAAQACGAVEAAEGNAGAALASLRRALQGWQELGAPYESARTRVLLAQACRLLGDEDTAATELEEARTVFARLGAIPDVVALDALERDAAPRDSGLTERELEVLRLVARGQGNRQIAATLVVSEHTVARHVQNIFRKLGVSSRTAATAYAFEHRLL